MTTTRTDADVTAPCSPDTFTARTEILNLVLFLTADLGPTKADEEFFGHPLHVKPTSADYAAGWMH